MKNKTFTSLYKFTLLLALTCSSIASAEPPEWVATAKAVEVTGELEILYFDDFENHRGEQRYFVHDKRQGKRFQLEFQDKLPKGMATGDFVRVRGKSKNHQIYMEANASNSYETLASAATATISGEQKTIVLVADFQDSSVSCPVQDIQETMFTDPNAKSINDLFQETSQGNIYLTGKVAGPFSIKSTVTDNCNLDAWIDAADSKAIASGINLNSYPRRVYVLPSDNGCKYTGIASVGGNPSQAIVFRCDMPDVYAHELGHNLGMGHASLPDKEYADYSDVMGYSNVGLRQINAPHQEQMGWRDSTAIIEVSESGIFDIVPLELDTFSAPDTQVIKIRKPDTNESYYLSYRFRTGFDSYLRSGYITGINIHRHAGGSQDTFFIDALSDGGSFVDDINGITINQISHDENGVMAEIIFSTTATACTRYTSEVTVSPLSRTASAGNSVTYAISINNRDSGNCPDSTWVINTQVPTGWADGAISEITVAPGSTNTFNWSVSSASNSADGNYPLSLDLMGMDSAMHDSTITANYTVSTSSDTQSPTTPSELSASLVRKKVLVEWQASSDNISVAGYRVYRNDRLAATTASTSYSDSNLVNGVTYTYYAVAFDAANNQSLRGNSSSLTYSKGGGNKGGGRR